MFVVYNKQSTKIVGSRHNKHWMNKAAAKAHLTRMGKMGYNVTEYAIAESTFYYANIEKTVTKTNLMTGEKYQERVGTPLYCSPSSETYWSM